MSFGALNLIPTLGQDVVAIYKQNDVGPSSEVLEGADKVRCSVNEHVTFFQQPLENGRNLIEHRIFQPVGIVFQMILVDSTSLANLATTGGFNVTARDLYDKIRRLFIDGTLLSIQTRTNVYPNQIIEAIPHEETSDIFNGVVLVFRSSEQFVESENTSFDPVDENDASTLQRGKLNALEAGATAGFVALATLAAIAG